MNKYDFIDPIFEQNDYEPLTQLWKDFSIADKFGESAIKDTYKNGLDYVKSDYKLFTEFVMVLNHKIWIWYESNTTIAKLYNDLWLEAEQQFYKVFKKNKEAMNYYYETTD